MSTIEDSQRQNSAKMGNGENKPREVDEE